MQKILLLLLLPFSLNVTAQQTLGKLTVEKIMRHPGWIGSSPSQLQWSADGRQLYFSWNPENGKADSSYFVGIGDTQPLKASISEKQNFLGENSKIYNQAKTAFAYAKDGDIFYTIIKTSKTQRVVHTTDLEYNPQFSFNDSMLVYTRSQNLYGWDTRTGETTQLTRLQSGAGASRGNTQRAENENDQEKWLKQDQLQTFTILKERKQKREATEAYNKKLPKEATLETIYIGDKNIQNLSISADGLFVSYRLYKSAGNNKGTIVPSYVTETGFTTDIAARTKVGEQAGSSELYIYDRQADSLIVIKTNDLPGISDLPDYTKDYPRKLADSIKTLTKRAVNFSNALWSPKGHSLLIDIRSQDYKDRWLMIWNKAGSNIKLADRQRDEAWIGGPGNFNRGWIDENNCWFLSEASGYSHLYTIDINTGQKKSITAGRYEVQEAALSKDKKYFYLTTNETHPGEKHFYRVPVTGGKAVRLTSMEGSNEVVLSPDEKTLAILYSYANKPTELFLQENAPGKKGRQVTDKAQSPEFKTYAWRDPELITFKARDGAEVYARLYKPAVQVANKPAVIFVHGAGYLQNAHKWWSSYFREYMFHNLLADEGYTVMDIDYRGSAGYGRDWRTGIYRHMGGKDLTDQVDAATFLSDSL
ncbi:MAG: DPP IV N-terminal domain-containing protein, partial [Gloeobacteraceae cyanobacterium ES-bin-316]|nr:DPP IV N-terminal domain-containing protein [Ferruginibacter sp.]